MAASALARFNTTTVAAASSFAIALGLVAVPPQGRDAGVARVEVVLVQLRASIATDTSALFNTVGLAAAAGAPTTADSGLDLGATSATAPAAADTGVNVLQNLVLGALSIAATPLWYLAFPVTLPLSIVGGIAYMAIGSVFITAVGGQVDPISLGLLGAVIGLGVFAAGPLAFAFSAISSAFAPASPAAAAAAIAATSSSATSERNASSTAPTPVAIGKPSTKAVRADTRSAKPSPASAITATAITESLTDYADAPMTDSITDAESESATQESAPIREGSKGGSDRASDRSGASRDRSRR